MVLPAGGARLMAYRIMEVVAGEVTTSRADLEEKLRRLLTLLEEQQERPAYATAASREEMRDLRRDLQQAGR